MTREMKVLSYNPGGNVGGPALIPNAKNGPCCKMLAEIGLAQITTVVTHPKQENRRKLDKPFQKSDDVFGFLLKKGKPCWKSFTPLILL